MKHETRVALQNYDWLLRQRGTQDVSIDWDTDTLIYGDGGAALESLCDEGFTPATCEEA